MTSPGRRVVNCIVASALRMVVTAIWIVVFVIEKLFHGIAGYFTASPPTFHGFDQRHYQPDGEKAARKFLMEHPLNIFNVLSFGKFISDNGKCVGYRPAAKAPYIYLTYSELIERAQNFGAGLLQLGGQPNNDYLVGIFAPTCVEWTVAEYGCMAYGMVVAPLYDALGGEACFLVTDFCKLEIMICGGDAQVDALMHDGKFPPSLRTVITIHEYLSEHRKAKLEDFGVQLLSVVEVEELGRLNPRPLCLSKPDSLATLSFTSGTTGIPKGVTITHRQMLTGVMALAQGFLPLQFGPDDTLLGLFPLAHILEREMEKLIHLHGGKVGYISGDVLTNWFADAKDVAPTVFLLVPRLNSHLCTEIQSDLNKSLYRRTLANLGVAVKKVEMEHGIFRKDSIWDRLVFRKYQNMLGGKIRVGVTGAAATDGEILNYARAVLGCYIFEIYGQSETAGIAFSTPYGEMSAGHVGLPLPGVEARLEDVPELEYFARDGRGEVCMRVTFGSNGYYKMPEKTAELIDRDGWIHTGDVGEWQPNGYMKIIDRKKHIFKLNQGEYLAPERLESTFARSNFIQNIFIDGNSKYEFCIALIYPNYKELGAHTADPKSPESEVLVKALIKEELVRIGQETGMQPWEVPERIVMLPEPFSLANGCLTPSQKKRRDGIRLKFRDEIINAYR
ncbi:long-chain-fatty-acid--CoA ligase 5-like [Paramacrobiotus metropolitanus]|uniref:long-chain-fatty-acid--CoA ligase 5-like n=1 Tax=Paramacrobiotus metropolitanus TaxID=2943436 RepID=UPI0024456F22|nr:long-chain-fatty-acid--CoA ligase 5-like [Paramacrobiotus metropolitanus]